ncbi:DUF998 domain-containing protein [Microbacterium sp. P01]|uniref:DUF998 domain-containing protein n=1 Tax=Microbacterium sp. P01 TaxID=3366261 RepID=UPI00366EADD2
MTLADSLISLPSLNTLRRSVTIHSRDRPWSMPRLAVPTIALPALSTSQLLGGIVAVLVLGIAFSIVTTNDPIWWHLYFSQLGTLGDFSAAIFNGTMVLCGVLFVAFSVRVYRDLRTHVGRSRSHHKAPHILAGAFISIGAHLAIVGLVPINTLKALHEQGASGMVLSFAAVLIGAPIVLRGIGTHLRKTSIPVTVLLVAGGTAMTLGYINLAAFELVAFSAMFTWILLFTAELRAHGARALQVVEAPSVALDAQPERPIAATTCTHDSLTALRPAPRVTLTPRAAVRHSAPARRRVVSTGAHSGREATGGRVSASLTGIAAESRSVRLRGPRRSAATVRVPVDSALVTV